MTMNTDPQKTISEQLIEAAKKIAHESALFADQNNNPNLTDKVAYEHAWTNFTQLVQQVEETQKALIRLNELERSYAAIAKEREILWRELDKLYQIQVPTPFAMETISNLRQQLGLTNE